MTDKTSRAYDMTLDLSFFRIHGHNHDALGLSIIVNNFFKLGLIKIVSSHLHLGCLGHSYCISYAKKKGVKLDPAVSVGTV
jgi:hypothetical protein